MNKEQVDALVDWVEAKIVSMNAPEDLLDSIREKSRLDVVYDTLEEYPDPAIPGTTRRPIALKDRLPEVGKRVLVYCRHTTLWYHATFTGVVEGEYTFDTGQVDRDCETIYVWEPSHWMDAPEILR